MSYFQKHVYVHYDREAHPTDSFQFCPFCRANLVLEEMGNLQRPTCPTCRFVQFKNPAPAVSVLVIHGDEFLLGQRIAAPGKGKWALPSGYIEYDDDFLTTAIREVQEETGLAVEIQSIIQVASSFLSPNFHFLAIYLLARVVGGELAPGDDLETVDWFPLAGPWPELAFPEDEDVLVAYAKGKLQTLPVDPDWAIQDRLD